MKVRVNSRNSQKTIKTVNVGYTAPLDSYFGVVNANGSNLISGTTNATLGILPGSGISISSNVSNNTLFISATAVMPTVVDSVSNTSTTIAGSANSITTSYNLALGALARAISAQVESSIAYSNAISFSSNANNITSGILNLSRLSITTANSILGRMSTSGIVQELSTTNLRSMLSLPNTSTTGRLAIFSDNNGSIGTTTGIFESAAGLVGIGTTSPTSNLHIASASTANISVLLLNGTWFTGGSAANNKPHFLIEPADTTSANWSTAGTGLGVNAPSGFAGNLIDAQLNGASRFRVSSTGQVTVPNGVAYACGTINVINATGIVTYLCNGNYTSTNGIAFTVSNFGLRNDLALGWYSTDPSGTFDTALHRDAAGAIAQRNGTNAQAFRVYNTYTNSSNYERIGLVWSSNTAYFTTENTGTGSIRNLFFGSTMTKGIHFYPTLNVFEFHTNGGSTHSFSSGSSSLGFGWNAGETAIYMIGNSGNNNRASNWLHLSCDGGTGNAAAGYLKVSTGIVGASGISSHTIEEAIRVRTNTSGSPILSFYDITSGSPALKRSGANLHVRLADDSDFAGLQASNLITNTLKFLEQTAPSAPSANQVVIFAEDNGAGKTRLMAQFNTGAAQQIAIEP